MDENRRYVRLGLFVLLGLAALAGALLLLGVRQWFKPTFIFETYFDQSIAGLGIGAPVTFRGVPLGQVTQILTSAATYEHDVSLDDRRDYIVVRVTVDTSGPEAVQMKRDAVALARRGLRARTHLAGVTGQQYLELDFMNPERYPPLPFAWKPEYTYLPSAPSSAGQIIANAQAFLASLDEVDIRKLGQNLNALVTRLDGKLGELPVAELSARLHDVLGSAEATLSRIDTTLGDPAIRETLDNAAVVSARLRKIVDDGDLDRTIRSVEETAERLDSLLGDNQYDVRVIVQDLQTTADNLRSLSETIRRYPAGAVFGGPPEKVELPERSP